MSKWDIRPILLSTAEENYFSKNIKLFKCSCLLAEVGKTPLMHSKKQSSRDTDPNLNSLLLCSCCQHCGKLYHYTKYWKHLLESKRKKLIFPGSLQCSSQSISHALIHTNKLKRNKTKSTKSDTTRLEMGGVFCPAAPFLKKKKKTTEVKYIL